MMKKSLLIIAAMLFFSTTAFAARQATLTFSWTVEAQETIASQGITELKVYQDSSENMVGTADPLSGLIVVDTVIDGASNFWATYATPELESPRSDHVAVQEPDRPDPVVQEIIAPSGWVRVTVEFGEVIK